MKTLLRRNVAANFIGRGWSAGLNLLLIPLYSRGLGIEAIGLIGVNALINQAINLLDLGLSPTMARETASLSAPVTTSNDEAHKFYDESAAAHLRSLVRSLEIVYWPIGIFIALAISLFAGPISHRWIITSTALPAASVQAAIVLMGLSAALQWPYTLYEGGLMGLQRQVLLNSILTVAATARGIGSLVVIHYWPTVSAFFIWQAIAFAGQTFGTAAALWACLPKSSSRPRFSKNLVSGVARFAGGMTGIAALGFLLTQMDKIVLSRTLSLQSYAYYTLAWSAAGGIYFIIAPVYSAYFPRFVHATTDAGSRSLSPLYHQACQLMSLLVLPVAAVLIVDPHNAMALWTQSAVLTQNTQALVALMAAGFALFAMMHIPLAAMLGAGDTSTVFRHNLATAALAVPAVIASVSLLGARGPMYVWIVVNLGYLVLLVPRVHRRLLPGEYGRWLREDVAGPAIACLGCAWLVHMLIRPWVGFGLPGRFVAGAWLAIQYLVALVAAALILPMVKRQIKTTFNTYLVDGAADVHTEVPRSSPGAVAERLHFLDGLRAIAAVYVMAHHAWLHVQIPPGIVSKLAFGLQFGHFAVDVFIVLSGFCLMIPVAASDGLIIRGGVIAFISRRCRRIMPAYFAAVFLSIGLIATAIGTKTGTHWDVSLPVSTRAVIAHLLLLQDFQSVVMGAKINHPLWSVAVEWHIYFLFPILVWLWRRIGSGASAITAVAISYVLGVAAVETGKLEGLHFQYIGLFALGMFGASVGFGRSCLPLRRLSGTAWYGLAALAAILTVLAGFVWRRVHGITVLCDPLVGIATLSLILALKGSRGGVLRRICEARLLVFVGGFSYSLYLIHAPLLQVVWQYMIVPLHFGAAQQFAILVSAGSVVIMTMAYLFYLIFERPFLHLSSRAAAAR